MCDDIEQTVYRLTSEQLLQIHADIAKSVYINLVNEKILTEFSLAKIAEQSIHVAGHFMLQYEKETSTVPELFMPWRLIK